MKGWLTPIKEMGACEDALKWGNQYNTFPEAWAGCERGDWMLWLLGRLSGKQESDSRKKLVLTACQCARLSLPYVKEGELRPLKAIETAEKWARGEDNVTITDVGYAAYAAYAAAYAAASAAASAAAYASRKETFSQCADIVREYYEVPDMKRGGA